MAANEVTITRAGDYLSNVTGANLQTRDVTKEIYKKSPQKATLMQIIIGTRRVITDNRLFEWYEQDLDPKWVTAGVVTAGGGTTGTIALSDTDQVLCVPGMTVRQDLNTVAHITAINRGAGVATITVDVITGFTQNSRIQLGASVTEELSAQPTAVTRVPAQITNRCETIRDAWGQSGWVETERVIAGKPRQHENRDTALLEHKIKLDIESWNASAPANAGTLNGNTIYYTNGIIAQIQTNRVACGNGGLLTFEQLITVAGQYDRLMESPEPYLFYSRAIASIFDIVAFQKTTPNNFDATGSEFGVHVKKLNLNNKIYKCVVVDHWMNGLGQHIIAIDPKHLTLRSTQYQGKVAGGSGTGMRWMIEDVRGRDLTGNDGTIGCITTDMGVKLENEQGAWMMTGITGC
jgi:hypothetical protein